MKFQECALSLAVLLVAATLSAPVRADLEKARQAFVDGDFETARREFTACAELGHPDAQFNLGAMYYNGNGGARNPALAFAWFLLAAENGIAEARAPLAEVQTQVTANDKPLVADILSKYRKATLQRELLPGDQAGAARDIIDRPLTLRRFDMIDEVEGGGPTSYHVTLRSTLYRFLAIDLVVAPDGTVRDVEQVISVPAGLYNKELFQFGTRYRFSPAPPGQTAPEVHRIALFTPGPTVNPYQARRGITELHDKYVACAKEGSVQCQYIESLLRPARNFMEYRPKPTDVEGPAPEKTMVAAENSPATDDGAGIADCGRECMQGSLLQSAQGGHPWAQYYIGRNLMYGAGSNADKARKWLEMAHDKGVQRAAVLLARLELNAAAADPSSWARASALLKSAAKEKEQMAQLPLAALQAAAPVENLRDPKKAVELAEKLRFRRANDPYVAEVLAAAAAARGDYKRAVKEQQEAIDRATSLQWKLDPLQDRLSKYQAGEPWFGDLLAW